jgi:hypothetical protein
MSRPVTSAAVGTDTIPYTSKYKGKQPFWDARPGLNIQTIDSLPLLLTEGYHKGRVSLPTLAKVLAENPALFALAYDAKGETARQVGVKGMPTSVLIDADGKVLAIHQGFREQDRAELEAKFVAALNPAKAP